MRAGSSFWASINPFLGGNAKIYDASFDLDTLQNTWVQIERTQAISINTHVFCDSFSTNRTIFDQSYTGSNNRRLSVFIDTAGRVNARWSNASTSLLMVRTNASISLNTPTSIIVTYTGNSLASGVAIYIAGISQALTIVNNNLTGTIINGVGLSVTIGRRGGTAAEFFSGKIRQLEIINRVATPSEIALASTAGSFQAASIANSDYLLAVDFNKTGTANLTTRAGTPTYTITAIGGASYTPYL